MEVDAAIQDKRAVNFFISIQVLRLFSRGDGLLLGRAIIGVRGGRGRGDGDADGAL